MIGLRWRGDVVGEYGASGKAKAYQETCTVEVVDAETGSLLARKVFRGGDPPKSIGSSDDDAWGSSCEDEVFEYVGSLFEKEG